MIRPWPRERRFVRCRGAAWLVAALAVVASACSEPPQAPAPAHATHAATGPHLATHTESIPDLAAEPTVTSAKAGPWSAPDTWTPARVPIAGDVVRIAPGTEVTYDVVSDAALDAVGVAGTLTFRTDADTRLLVTHLLVYAGGTLAVGDERRPVSPDARAEIVFANRPLLSGTAAQPGRDGQQFGNGLLVWGRLSIVGAPRLPAFERLADDVQAGERVVRLRAVPRGWRAGDLVLLPDSRQATDAERSAPAWELVRIARLEGAAVELDAPTRHAHLGARATTGALATGLTRQRLLPHAANVSRNIVLRSEDPAGVRGHTMILRGGDATIVNARFEDLGRTTTAPLDNAVLENGRVTRPGTNQASRYPVHLHHVVDAATFAATRPAFVIRGVVVAGAPRWGLSVHGSHFGVVAENVVYDVAGAGIVTEDGSETGNRFERNLVAGARGSGEAFDARKLAQGHGHEGAGFWIGSDNNAFVGNVAAGVRDGGFTFFRDGDAQPFPAFPQRAGEHWPEPRRAAEFSGNEVYGATGAGIRLWDGKTCKICRDQQTIIRDTTIWHSRTGLSYDYHADYYRVDGLVVQGDPARVEGTLGVAANGGRRIDLTRARIAAVDVGIDGGGNLNRRFDVADATVQARVGLRIRRGRSWENFETVTVRNVSVDLLPATPAGRLIALSEESAGPGRVKAMLRRPIYFTNFRPGGGRAFQLFFPDQAPDAPVPQNPRPEFGCPVERMTNAECMRRYGIATGGEVASCATVLPGVDGFACPVAPTALPPRR